MICRIGYLHKLYGQTFLNCRDHLGILDLIKMDGLRRFFNGLQDLLILLVAEISVIIPYFRRVTLTEFSKDCIDGCYVLNEYKLTVYTSSVRIKLLLMAIMPIIYLPWRFYCNAVIIGLGGHLNIKILSYPWREHHRYSRTTLSIMSMGWRSVNQCNWLRWSNWDRTADLTAPCVFSD